MKLLFRVKISGESMWPVLVSGKTYWASGLLRPRVGDAIVFCDPRNADRLFVKRVRAVVQEGYEVESSVSWGSRSDTLGIISKRSVLGIIFSFSIWGAARRVLFL